MDERGEIEIFIRDFEAIISCSNAFLELILLHLGGCWRNLKNKSRYNFLQKLKKLYIYIYTYLEDLEDNNTKDGRITHKIPNSRKRNIPRCLPLAVRDANARSIRKCFRLRIINRAWEPSSTVCVLNTCNNKFLEI